MNSVLFESKVKLEDSFCKRYLVLDDKKFEIKKKKNLFSSELIVCDTYLIKDIKMTNSRILVRVKDIKYVEVILNNRSLLIKFTNEELAREFSDKLIELKEKESLFSRGIDKIKGISFGDVKGVLKAGCALVGLASNLPKSEKTKKLLKNIGTIGTLVIDAIPDGSDNEDDKETLE